MESGVWRTDLGDNPPMACDGRTMSIKAPLTQCAIVTTSNELTLILLTVADHILSGRRTDCSPLNKIHRKIRGYFRALSKAPRSL